MLNSDTVGTPGRPKKLSTRERVQLALAERKNASAATRQRVIFRREDSSTPAPLSFAQQRMWFLDQMEPGSAAYNLPAALRLTGRLDVAALERAFGELVRRHEILRTTFAEAEGRPVQVVGPFEPQPLPVKDLSGLSEDERESEVGRLADDERHRPFDLAQGPLLRVMLLRLSEGEQVLLITMHHIVSDGWSVGVLVRELNALYVAYAKGEESPLDELPVQYADYAAWQRDYLTGEILERQLSYWKEQLAGVPALLALPTDRPRPPVQSYRGAEVSFTLPAELAAEMRRLGQAHGCTLFMTLLAGWQALLSRYSGQDDVVVGTPIAGRIRRETEDLIGLFVNTLALRTSLSGDPTFAELLGRVREVTLGAYTHQEVPFERLVEELQPERSLSHPPLFQAMFSLQNAPRERMALGGVAASAFGGGGTRVEKFDLTLELAEGAGGVGGALSYSTALFDHATAERLLAHYVTLLAAAAARPDEPVSDVPLLSEEERRRLGVWNDTREEFDERLCVQNLFERQARLTPDAVAVVFGDEQLTYRQLDERAARLARGLRGIGVGRESRVGVMVSRSAALPVALLAVLKAGGAYVPLDPTYPADRLAYMAEDARLSALITEQGLLERTPPTSARVVTLDGAWPPDSGPDARGDLSGAEGSDAAYVIYTSGSTGRPKGVVIEHRTVVNFLAAMRSLFHTGPGDLCLAVTTISFDIAALELYLPLATGARVEIVTAEEAADGLLLARRLERGDVTLMQATPSTWRLLLAAGWRGQPNLTTLCGGEALPGDLAAELAARCGRLWNMYGPTETTIWSTAREVSSDALARAAQTSAAVGIGGPINNTSVHVLDPRLRPQPAGVHGEVFIGGTGLARGYLNRADLTAEKFIPDPFSQEPGARMYRTGDAARRLAGGEVEYLGRLDSQVKVRGFRIELGEIESALREYEAVSEAVAVVREDGPGDKRLVAYVVAGEGEGAALAPGLRAYLRERLPEYMVPSAFVVLDELPLTRNGKIDRKALPAPERAAGSNEYVAPRTEVEEALARIWAEVLKVERVGVNDNFFELGGHSLLAMQLISRVREMFDNDFPVRAVFESPTVAEMAEALSPLGAKEDVGEGGPVIERVAREGTLPLSFTQDHVWSLAKLTPDVTGPRKSRNMDVIFRLKGPLKFDVLERALAELGRRHEILRTTYAEVEGNLVPLVAPTLSGALSVVDLQALPAPEREQEAKRLVAEYVRHPFDLAGDVLLRATLLRLAAQEHVLVFVIDHFIFDGWSKDVFMNELAVIYDAFYHEQPSPLPELEVQFLDWAAWQRSKFSGEAAKEFIDFWRERLDMSHPFPRLELPQVLPPPAVVTRLGQTHWKVLPRTMLEKLEALGRDKQATLFMVQLAVLNTVLHAYTGKEQLAVITNAANRERPETQQLFGWLSNQLILPTDLSGNPTFSQLLERVRAMCQSVFEHSDLPLPQLMELLNDGDDPVAPPYVFLSAQPDRRADGQRLAEKLRLADLTINTVPLEPPEHVPGTGIWVNADVVAEGLQISIDSGVDQYRPETMIEVLEFYCRVIESVVADPEQTLSELATLLREEVEVAG
ncbi:MAG TPA: amino acid adenylation domain-containing protein [Pyrinomonadaceae bacterium]|nr:amino acid adenylation domain-containing protein [Pyrinomonadaceae bacterium]